MLQRDRASRLSYHLQTTNHRHEVAFIERDDLCVEILRLHLAEAKDLLHKFQKVVAAERLAAPALLLRKLGQVHPAQPPGQAFAELT